MKNEYKIDYVSMHEDQDLGLRSFGFLIVALERGLRSARAGPLQFDSFQLFWIFSPFGIFWRRLGIYFGTPHRPFLTLKSLEHFLLSL